MYGNGKLGDVVRLCTASHRVVPAATGVKLAEARSQRDGYGWLPQPTTEREFRGDSKKTR